nr:phospholipase A2-like [Halyomorpha halys]
MSGTKWCGSGNSAVSYNDLGKQKATDSCCREHDHCPDVIEAGKTGHGLSNPSVYTRLHCDCDKKFLNCLRRSAITEKTSNIVGLLYFDALHTQCYREDYPVIGCVKYSSVPRRCQEYAFNRTASKKEWHWFDVPLF